VGPLDFRDCPVQVSAKNIAGHDGMVGPDFFSQYLVTLDFPGQMLRLSQLPKWEASEDPPAESSSSQRDPGSAPAEARSEDPDHETKDGDLPPGMGSYTRIFRFGHMLLVPTSVNDSPKRLFLMDSGSDHCYVSPEAAREVTKVSDDPDTRVLGLGGSVKKVYRADKATLMFGGYKQENQDLISFDLSGLSQNTGTEISGTLGFALLRVLKVTIDYRDGLVDFSYDPTRVH
jgi:hypothetical protein